LKIGKIKSLSLLLVLFPFFIIIYTQLNPSNGELIEKAKTAQRFSNYVEAEKIWQRVIKNNPENIEARINLGIALFEQQKPREGLKEFSDVIKLKPNSADAYYSEALLLYYKKQLDSAIEKFQKAISLGSKNGMTYYYLGNALSDQKRLDEAIKQYQIAIKHDTEYARAYNNLGFALYNKEEWNKASEQYQIAIKLDPKYARAYNNLGLALQKERNLEEAIKNYKESIKLDPKYVYAQNNLAEAERELERQKNQLAVKENLPSSEDKLSLLKRSVVKVVAQIPQGNSIGTGWVMKLQSDSALIVTNRHVVTSGKGDNRKSSQEIEVEFYSENDNNERLRLPAKISKIVPNTEDFDLALLEVKNVPSDIKPLLISDTKVTHGQKVRIIGHPSGGTDWTIVSGEISNIIARTQQLQLSNVTLSVGNSGSPVLNEQDNQVVGVLTYIEPQYQSVAKLNTGGFGFAYKIELVKNKLGG
jgi:superkiller protein 3